MIIKEDHRSLHRAQFYIPMLQKTSDIANWQLQIATQKRDAYAKTRHENATICQLPIFFFNMIYMILHDLHLHFTRFTFTFYMIFYMVLHDLLHDLHDP
jgi:hypothetical protein